MKTKTLSRSCLSSAGFSLVEILVSLAVLAILLLINVQVIDQVQSTWAASNARVSQFREARTAFDILVRNISQATLNSYGDYNANYVATAASNAGVSSQVTTSYVRKSDLQFKCGNASSLLGGGSDTFPGHAVFFQAPLGISENPAIVGLDRLLCARGYFVQFSSDEPFVPEFLADSVQPKFRYRLMEYSPPTEDNNIYAAPHGPAGILNSNLWYSDAAAQLNEQESALNSSNTRPVADNILALIISPRREQLPGSSASPTIIAPNYAYDSTVVRLNTAQYPQGTQNMLPPLVKIVLVAIDERSAGRLAEQHGNSPPFNTSLTAPISTASNLEMTEIPALVSYLSSQNVNYRIFSATVQIRSSKGGL